MRLPYVPNPPQTTTPEDAAIVSRIQARRAPRPLQALDLTLLHAPPVADGWNSFLGAVRTQTTIPADLRELAISRVAVVNKAWYEWGHHAPLAVAAGVSPEGMDAIKTEAPLELASRPALYLSEKQWAVLVYSDEMTRTVRVKDETFAKLKELFNEREVVEITTTVAGYNCVSRFLVALDGKMKSSVFKLIIDSNVQAVGERNSTGPDDVALPSH
ncbi:carboxymuconolactone decarboxylase [Colletotrichum phormii]|uniref:Carboxymuconolactone decarboxylase n=1 Tax=Colletotrichum phormii TaxID=359342 RepID=A0AAJ0A1Q6_9PEZI|nr:carboxymuconolactone decarboxylase [Colletotrichum phormii]KAK1654338.1 carboxymuconolactone decarboxylase [Colletotrichum phormii]